MPAGYVRVWLSMEAAIGHVMQVAQCGRQEARDALVQAIHDEEIRSQFGDNGLQDIKAFLWENARHWAPYSGFGARMPNRVRIAGDLAYLRPYFDPPPDPSLLPERMRPVELRREDLERLWPLLPALEEPRGPLKRPAAGMEAFDTEERLALKWRREKWRRQWIAEFAERQRATRRWIAITDLVGWCAHSTTTASLEAEAQAREVAYRRLINSLLKGEFERDDRSRILYLDTLVMSDGASPRCRLTREQFEIAFDATAALPAPSLPITVLNCCWLPANLAQQWLEAHGYRLPPYLERSRGAGEGIENRDEWKWHPTPELRSAIRKAISALGRPPGNPRWEVFCDRVRLEGKACGMRPYTDRHIKRAFTAIEAEGGKRSRPI